MPASGRLTKSKLFLILILTIPMYTLAWFLKDSVQIVLDITGGLCGWFLVFIFPATYVYYSRKKYN